MSYRTLQAYTLSAALLAGGLWAGVAGAQEPAPPPEPGAAGEAAAPQDAAGARDLRLARELTVEVRSAPVGDLLQQLTRALGVPMMAQPGVAAQRVTLRTGQTTVQGLQQALAGLLNTQWRSAGTGEEAEYVLLDNPLLTTQAAALRRQRQAALVNGVLATASALGRYDPEYVASSIRARVAARLPEGARGSAEEITPVYLNQALLAAPLRQGGASLLSRTGSAALLFYNLNPRSQQLLAEFMLERAGALAPAAPAAPAADEGAPSVSPLALNSPRARVEYRTMYGDRWSGLLFITRVGVADSWAAAALPSALYNLPDYSALYPQATERPAARELYSPVDVKLDTGSLTWDQAIASLSRAARINILTDSYTRPEVFRPSGTPPVISGANLEQVLNRLAAHYGQFWWKEGDWYLLRSRQWGEEAAAALAPALLRALGTSAARDGRLSAADYDALARLTDEQLMTLHLEANSRDGRAPDEAFDYNAIQSARSGLALAAQLTDRQRDLARTAGLPYLQMTRPQALVFSAMAADYGAPVDRLEPYRWRFRITERFTPAGVAPQGSGASQSGVLAFRFEGPNWSREGALHLRLPTPEPVAQPNP